MYKRLYIRTLPGNLLLLPMQSINQSHILNTSPRQVVVLASYSYSVQQNFMPMHKITINNDDSLYYIQAEQ